MSEVCSLDRHEKESFGGPFISIVFMELYFTESPVMKFALHKIIYNSYKKKIKGKETKRCIPY